MEVTELNLSKNTMQMTETALMAAVMAVLSTIGILYIPIVLLFLPVPFIVLGIKNSLKSSVIALVASALVATTLIDPILVICMSLITLAIGTGLVVSEKRKFSSATILGLTCLITVLTIVAMMGALWFITGVSFAEVVGDFINSSKELTIQMAEELRAQGMLMFDHELFMENLEQTAHIQALIIPSAIIMISFLLTYCSFWGSIVILRKMQIKRRSVPKLERFALPNNVLLGFLVITMGIFVVGELDFIHYEALVWNVVVLVSSVLFLQGTGVGLYLIRRSPIPKAVQIILMGFIFLFTPYVFTLCGLIDVIVDFRKIKKMGNGDRNEN
jgi:uncharacterized protein YybS (DUF2232 family)